MPEEPKKLLKMMAAAPSNNIDRFIQDCVLEPGTIDSLNNLREQKSSLEDLKDIYSNLKNEKEQLDKIEDLTCEYEAKSRALEIRNLMLPYQKVMEMQENIETEKTRRKEFQQHLEFLNQRQKDLESQANYALERLNAAKNSSGLQEMTASIQTMENRLEVLQNQVITDEKETAKLKRLQLALTGSLKWFLDDVFTQDPDRVCMENIAEVGADSIKKAALFQQLCTVAKNTRNTLQEDKFRNREKTRQIDENLRTVLDQINTLNANRMIEPKETTEAKSIITKELEKRGIKTEVRTFAELVQSVKDEKWRKAIETYLGNRRHNLIIDSKYCRQAINIQHERSLKSAAVVATHRLPDFDIELGSAAEQLEIPNADARRYANYLLNEIHLCRDLDELDAHIKGGLMQDGTLAKSYAVSIMDMQKTKAYLGFKAIELQKADALRRKSELESALVNAKDEGYAIQERLNQIDDVIWRVDNYHFAAPEELAARQNEMQTIQQDINSIKTNPDFTTAFDELQRASDLYNQARKNVNSNNEDIGACKNDLKTSEERLSCMAAGIIELQENYDAKRSKRPDLEPIMLDEYNKARTRRQSVRVIQEDTVAKLSGETYNCKCNMERAQIDYCRMAGLDQGKIGPSYIPLYREQRQLTTNTKIEEAKNKIDKAKKEFEGNFIHDFVAKLNETIEDAKREIAVINNGLKQMPFGGDTYQFIMTPKPDRDAFFRICKKHEDYADLPALYANSIATDEELEQDIQEFMSNVLDEENEKEYTDYRKYFTYDMEIVSNRGGTQTSANLSKKQGSASNGEKQTPYFIILAASLMQYYPKTSCCARLALVDEAFAVLSRDRIEQMVKYFEMNNFQVIYAAPPEKMSSIGQFVSTTVCLVNTGRYAQAVEGLIKHEDLQAGQDAETDPVEAT